MIVPDRTRLTVRPKIATCIKQSGDKMTLKQLFEALSLTDFVAKIVTVCDYCIANKNLYTIVSAVPDIYIKFEPTLTKLSQVTIPSLTNIGNSLVLATVSTSNLLRLAKDDASSDNVIQKVVKVSKSVSENPDKVSVGDVCKDTGVDATKVVAPMKTVNKSVKSTSTSTIVTKTTGKDTTTLGKNVKNLASKAKDGKVTVDDCANAAKAAEEVINPTGGDGSHTGGDVTPKSKKTLFIIIGCSIGGIAIAALVIGCVLFVRRNRRESTYKELTL